MIPDPSELPRAPVPAPSHRLIPSRYPPIPAFEAVSDPADLDAVMELEGWTNDRLVAHRLARLPEAERVYGRPNASVVMAAFLHSPPTGQRFTSGALGAWYAALELKTAIAEVAHHLRREAVNTGQGELRVTYRAYTARLDGEYRDLRGAELPELYAPDDYTAGQAFGERARAAGEDGLLYDSVRLTGGSNAVAYRPRQVQEVTQGAHYDLIVPVTGRITARELRDD